MNQAGLGNWRVAGDIEFVRLFSLKKDIDDGFFSGECRQVDIELAGRAAIHRRNPPFLAMAAGHEDDFSDRARREDAGFVPFDRHVADDIYGRALQIKRGVIGPAQDGRRENHGAGQLQGCSGAFEKGGIQSRGSEINMSGEQVGERHRGVVRRW